MSARPKLAAGLLFALAACTTARAGVVLGENFDDIEAIPPGWVIMNNSSPINVPPGLTEWFQGNPAIFASQSGAVNSYVAANIYAAALGGNVSLWALSPVLSVNNGGQIAFYTRSAGVTDGYPGDNLDILLSTNGASTNLADFTTLLTIPGDGTYPSDWTRYVLTISGLSGLTDVRFAFNYVVTDTSVNGDYIGIDSLIVTDSAPEPSTLAFVLSGLALLGLRWRRASRLG